MPLPLAPSSSRSEIRDHLTFVVRVLEQHRSLDSLMEGAAAIDFGTAATRISELRARYEEPFRLAVVGEFKAGKSTLINALLGRPGLVPEGATPTTGAVTEIWWGEEERGEVLDGSGKQVFVGNLQDAVRFADQRSTEGKKVSGQGARVILRVTSDFLRNLVILDTPGLGANARDDKVTLDSLHLADAAILVVNGLQPGGEDSLTLSERLRTTQRKLITVVTRIDLATNPSDALDAAKTVFGAVADGDPIGVASPVVMKALDQLKVADEKRDQDGLKAANDVLQTSGYFALRERLQEGCFAGQAAAARASRTIADLRGMLHRLELQAAQEAGRTQKKADEIESELTAAQRRINEVLRPKVPFLEAKIDEAVDKHISEFISEMGEAVDVFIDRVVDGGLELGVRSIAAKFSSKQQEKLNARLRDDFRDVFPDDQLEIVVSQIARNVRSLMELEWREISVKATAPGDSKTFDPTGLIRQMCDHIAQLTAALASEMAAWVMLLFVPGGVIIDLALMFLSLGVGAYVSGKEAARVSRSKREVKVRLRGMRRQLVHELAEHFRKINRDTADELIGRVSDTSSAKDKARLDLLGIAERWRAAHEETRRLIADAEEIAFGAAT
jgi:predicted GTPase